MVDFCRSFALPAFLFLAAGCSSLEPENPLDDPEVKERLGRWAEPLPLRVGVFVGPGTGPSGEEIHGQTFAIDGYNLRKGLVRLLKESRLFQEVLELTPRGIGKATPEAKAREMDLALLVRVDPRGGRVKYVGRNLLWWPSLALWLIAWFPSWMVADETYRMDVGAFTEVTDLGEGKPLGRFDVAGSVETGLNDVERGFHLLGIIRVPWCLNAMDYRNVRRKLSPLAWSRFHIAFLLELARVLERAYPPPAIE